MPAYTNAAALDLGHDLLSQRPRVQLVARLRVLGHPIVGIDTQDDEVLDGVHGAQNITRLVDRPILTEERLRREEQVLPVLHVDDRELAQRVLVVPRRQIAAELVVAAKDFRWELHERGEPPHLGTEEVWVGDACVRLGHESQLVGTEGPVRRPALDETRLEVQERLIRFELEGGHSAVIADRDRLRFASQSFSVRSTMPPRAAG